VFISIILIKIGVTFSSIVLYIFSLERIPNKLFNSFYFWLVSSSVGCTWVFIDLSASAISEIKVDASKNRPNLVYIKHWPYYTLELIFEG